MTPPSWSTRLRHIPRVRPASSRSARRTPSPDLGTAAMGATQDQPAPGRPRHAARALGVLLALFVCGVASACRRSKPAAPEPPPVCALRLAEHLRHTEPEALPAEVWFQLLFKGYRKGSPPRDAVDCLGDPVQWEPLPTRCKEQEPLRRPLPAAPLGAKDLIIRNASGNYWFGWAPFRRFEGGMAEGPIAIARVHKGRLEFRAIGTLRAYTERLRLEVRKVGGSHVLVAEGESCGQQQADCQRAMRLMWLDRQRFRMRPLRAATVRDCLGPAWFPMTEEISRRLDSRWQRTLRRDLAVAFEDDRITIDESIAVFDRDLQQAALPPRIFREAQAKLWIRVIDGELATEGQSIWPTIQIEDAATDREAQP